MSNWPIDERPFLERYRRSPFDPLHQVVYADWLEERSDPRAEVLRLNLVLRYTSADNVQRFMREDVYSQARSQVEDQAWLQLIDPRTKAIDGEFQHRCQCIRLRRSKVRTRFVPELHAEWQDTLSPGWLKLEEIIDKAANEGVEDLVPLTNLGRSERLDIVTLPPSIARLKNVRRLQLYGSNLIRIPPEIAEMHALENFVPYTSYRLHWFPYEIRSCRSLRDSTISTRALYGNFKYRGAFPKLEPTLSGVHQDVLDALDTIAIWEAAPERPCSVCRRVFADRQQFRCWISLGIGTDVVPLLVNACSQACIDKLPMPPENYVGEPHLGGANVEQPPESGY